MRPLLPALAVALMLGTPSLAAECGGPFPDFVSGLKAEAVVGFTAFWEIHDHRVVEHCAFALWHGFQAFDDARHLLDLRNADLLSDRVGGDAAVAVAVAD
jgi:hypothetical protein